MARRQRIEELRGIGLDALTPEQLAELNTLVGEEIAELRGKDVTPEIVADLRTYVGISGEVTAEDDRRTEAAEALENERRELLAQVDGGEGEHSEGEQGGEGEQTEGEQAGEGETAGDGEQQTEQAVAAGGAPVARPRRANLQSMARRTRTVTPPPADDTDPGLIPLVASADGSRSGERVTGMKIAELIGTRIKQLGNTIGRGDDGDQLYVAGANYADRFGDRQFGESAVRNTEILEGITAEMRSFGRRPDAEAVMASGGVCAVYPMDYTYDAIGVQDRPIRDSLPSGTAPRGGVQFYQPPLYDATIYGQGVRQWTYANDAAVDPADDSTWKPCMEFDCGTPATAELYAVPQCAEISNLRNKFNPENVATNLYYLGIAHSALGDSLLFNAMVAKSRYVQEAGQVSAVRDLLTYLDVTIASMRDQYRLPDSQAMHIDLPHWAKEVFRIDMLRSAFPDDFGGTSRFAITDAQIAAWFATRKTTVTWMLDPYDASQQLTPQAVASLGSPGSLNNLPSTVKFLIYPEGTFTFLDGGSLDLGVTRDSRLNRMNRFQLFMETFEGLVMRGVQSQFHKAVLNPSGASVGTVAAVTYSTTL